MANRRFFPLGCIQQLLDRPRHGIQVLAQGYRRFAVFHVVYVGTQDGQRRAQIVTDVHGKDPVTLRTLPEFIFNAL